jgi:nitrate reductase gamma subunit
MVLLIYLITYASILTFIIAVVARAIRLMKTPVHVRWELYPVAHEKEHLKHGGSFMEDLEWWNKPRETSTINMLSRMIPEMIFIKALWENNRQLWFRSFPFHFGLYMLIVFMVLLFIGAFLEIAGVLIAADSGSSVGAVVFYLTKLFGAIGVILALIGSIGLLHRRLTDEALEGYTNSSHILNLIFFIVTLTVSFLSFVLFDSSFSIARGFVYGLITFSFQPIGSTFVALEIILASILIAYIPLTHMSHFFTKYFSYHEVLWDDEPNRPGSLLETRLLEYLNYPVSWSATHIGGDGKKTWVDVATEEIEK